MSEKKAKEARRQEETEEPRQEAPDLGNHLFDLTISVYDTGRFTMYAPEGASIPLALDCCMRASQRLWAMIVAKFSKPNQPPLIVPGRKADIDVIEAIKRGQA
jgi:hypothetical protein